MGVSRSGSSCELVRRANLVLTALPGSRRHAAALLARAAVLVVASLVPLFFSRAAAADVVEAVPLVPIVAPFPAGVAPIEAQVVLQLVVDANGSVESAIETSRAPKDAPDALVQAAIDTAKAAKF